MGFNEFHFTQHDTKGPSLFNPTLSMPGCTTARCNNNSSDLEFYNGKFYPSDRAVWSWEGGVPTEAASTARAGVFTVHGTFSMTVTPPPLPHKHLGKSGGHRNSVVMTAASPSTAMSAAHENSTGAGVARKGKSWKLTVYLGLYNFGAFRNSATFTASSPNQETIHRTVEHDNGNNNDWLNTAFEIVFESEVTVTWSLDVDQCIDAKCGMASWQSAKLEHFSAEDYGGIVVESATLFDV